eukprot:gnl/TRDRNA2_/TRDRNA2_82749_c0_seq1.p1 gnl/TRDRNA2_/TRDRNA2_82749_c0~~gnl/TRDRNA2_/TRDRNA2_82749_c0_seq1.p1  ORF type:complete len:402 (-),score=66.56 gnl/TRDRNA2_/TRDRNA2_82749_c0_seq1:44-1180(-)
MAVMALLALLPHSLRSVAATISSELPSSLASEGRPAELPVFDLDTFNRGGAAREAALAELRAACEVHGFLYLAGHGISEDVLDGMATAARRFFKLPAEAKEQLAARYQAVRPSTSRGFIKVKQEALDPRKGGDIKEVLDLGREGTLEHAQTPFQGPNLWPHSLSDAEFRYPAMRHLDAMWGLARNLTHAFALSLSLPETYFDEFVNDPIIIHRLNYYPPHVPTTVEHLNCGEHTDYGFFTLLQQVQDVGTSEDLQIHVGDGKWVTAPSVPGLLNVNLGDMMERWTNGRYKATLHRVVANSEKERWSFPFFFDPNYNATVAPVPTCVREGEKPLYAPVEAGKRKLAKFEATWSELEPSTGWDEAKHGALFRNSERSAEL